MSRSSGLGFGGFLLGLGVAWLLLTTFDISGNLFSWIVILVGISIVVSSILSRSSSLSHVNQLIGGIIGGFICALVFSYAFGFIGFFPGVGSVTGSGNIVRETKSITGFTSVSAAMGFNIEISESNTYNVVLIADDNIMDKIRVSKEGDTLLIRLTPGSYISTTLKAEITMPEIKKLELSGGSGGSIDGFEDLTIFDLELSGGSHVNIVGSSSNLNVDASGGSTLDLSDFLVHDADIIFSGGSSGIINLDGTLDADLSGGSRLSYIGDPYLGDIDTSGASSLNKK